VEAFVQQAVTDTNGRLFRYEADILQGLGAHVSAQRDVGGPPVLAFVLGTRVGDPNCKGQTAFAPSSDWMPPFMRVNPILDWDYGLVWAFIRAFSLPYCALYDQGYTSLGHTEDTVPNPALARPDGQGHYPAHMLADWTLERAGRVSKRKAPAKEGEAPENPRASPTRAAADVRPRRRSVRSARTAGLVIIGDELLKAKVQDTNAHYALQVLRKAGLDCQRVAVVPDVLEDIADEVRRQSQRLDLVITSGGVGPTHDDVTIRAVAEALGEGLEEHARMVAMIKEAYGVEELTEAQGKMARLPASTRLRTVPGGPNGEPSKWPILQVQNIFVLPGVPAFFEKKLDDIVEHFVATERTIHTRQLVLNVAEEHLVAKLNALVARYPDVSFGSYPSVETPDFKTVITIESESEARAGEAVAALEADVGAAAVVRRPSKDLRRMLN